MVRRTVALVRPESAQGVVVDQHDPGSGNPTGTTMRRKGAPAEGGSGTAADGHLARRRPGAAGINAAD